MTRISQKKISFFFFAEGGGGLRGDSVSEFFSKKRIQI